MSSRTSSAKERVCDQTAYATKYPSLKKKRRKESNGKKRRKGVGIKRKEKGKIKKKGR